MKLSHLVVASAFTLAGTCSQAAIVTSTLSNVTILGNAYNVTFNQDSDGLTTFNDVFGSNGSPTLTFNSGNALLAAQQLLAAVNTANFDITPGSSNPAREAFALLFAYDANFETYYTGWRNTPGNSFSGTFGPSGQISRNTELVGSFATFARVAVAVPEPGSLALAGIALMGLAAARRKSKPA